MKIKNFVIGGLSLCLMLLIGQTSCNVANSTDTLANIEPYQVTDQGLKWYSVDDLDQMKIDPSKKILVDVYTSWCGWCKVMDRKTFTNQEVVDYLNQNFILVKFNAESRNEVNFNGKTYSFMNVGRRGANGLAVEMLGGRMGYPTLVYYDASLNKIRSSPGYKSPSQLLSELRGLTGA